MDLAVSSWSMVESRAVHAGIWGRPGGAERLVDVDATVFLAWLEGLAREDEEADKELTKLYEARAAEAVPAATRAADRGTEIAELLALTAM